MSEPQLKKEQQDNKGFPNEFILNKGRVIPPPDLPKIEDAGEVIFCRDIMTAFVIVHKHK
jgi:hypothetical protein